MSIIKKERIYYHWNLYPSTLFTVLRQFLSHNYRYCFLSPPRAALFLYSQMSNCQTVKRQSQTVHCVASCNVVPLAALISQWLPSVPFLWRCFHSYCRLYWNYQSPFLSGDRRTRESFISTKTSAPLEARNLVKRVISRSRWQGANLIIVQAPVVQKLDSAIQRRNHYPVDKY